MNPTTPGIEALARRLLAFEAMLDPSDGSIGAATRACEKLRVSLTRLLGVAGFGALLSRALAMAKDEIPSLDAVEMRPDGSLRVPAEIGRTHNSEAGVVIVGQLLGLLVTFIGESLTMPLVRDSWPDVSMVGIDAGSGEGS